MILHRQQFLLVTLYRPDIVLYNESNNLVAMFELTYPLDSVDHLRVWKQEKREYHLRIPCLYDTVELSVLGDYLPASFSSFLNCADFIQN